MTTYSSDPEVDAAAAVFAARGYSVSEAIRLAHLQVSEARSATPLTKVLPAAEYGPLSANVGDGIVYAGHPDQLPPIRGRS